MEFPGNKIQYPGVKASLVRLGVLVPPKAVYLANGVLNYLNVGRWFHDRRLTVPARLPDRPQFYQCLARQIHEPASYLEFGVFQGASLRQWTTLLKHPDTFFHGFDSFVGLPEDWRVVSKDEFNLKGVLPQFNDPRVKLFKGWFSETLPGYLAGFAPHPNLVVHIDADLYSSTKYVLDQIRPFLRPGSVLIFDEIFDRDHELKALTEFLNEHPFAIECLAATRTLTQAAFRLTAVPSR